MNNENGTDFEALESVARAAKARYQREWSKKNRDKVRAYNVRYWARKAAALAVSEQANNNGENNEDRQD